MKILFVTVKHWSESDCSKTTVRWKKRNTNSLGHRPPKIHLLTYSEVLEDMNLIDRTTENTFIRNSVVEFQKNFTGDAECNVKSRGWNEPVRCNFFVGRFGAVWTCFSNR